MCTLTYRYIYIYTPTYTHVHMRIPTQTHTCTYVVGASRACMKALFQMTLPLCAPASQRGLGEAHSAAPSLEAALRRCTVSYSIRASRPTWGTWIEEARRAQVSRLESLRFKMQCRGLKAGGFCMKVLRSSWAPERIRHFQH